MCNNGNFDGTFVPHTQTSGKVSFSEFTCLEIAIIMFSSSYFPPSFNYHRKISEPKKFVTTILTTAMACGCKHLLSYGPNMFRQLRTRPTRESNLLKDVEHRRQLSTILIEMKPAKLFWKLEKQVYFIKLGDFERFPESLSSVFSMAFNIYPI